MNAQVIAYPILTAVKVYIALLQQKIELFLVAKGLPNLAIIIVSKANISSNWSTNNSGRLANELTHPSTVVIAVAPASACTVAIGNIYT